MEHRVTAVFQLKIAAVDVESARRLPTRHVSFVARVDDLVKKSGYLFNGVEVPQNNNDPYTIRYAEANSPRTYLYSLIVDGRIVDTKPSY